MNIERSGETKARTQNRPDPARDRSQPTFWAQQTTPDTRTLYVHGEKIHYKEEFLNKNGKFSKHPLSCSAGYILGS